MQLTVTIDHVKNVLLKYIYLSNTNVVDAVLGCVIANQLPGPPVSMYLIASPSSGKTEILNGLEGYYRTYHPSKITANTLISGYVEKGKGGVTKKTSKEHSLIVRLTNEGKNILVFKDFTTVLEFPDETKRAIISQFREIADGRYTGDSGFGSEGNVVWRGKLAVITGVTNSIDEFTSTNSILGERFICFRMSLEQLDEVQDAVISSVSHLDDLRADFTRITNEFLMQFDIGCDHVPMKPEVVQYMKHLSAFVAISRTGIIRDRQHHILSIPQREGFGRISRQLQAFGSGVALARGHDSIDIEDYKLIKKVARDTIPPLRNLILHHVYHHRKDGVSVRDLVPAIRIIPERTMYRYIEDLDLVGAVMPVEIRTGHQGPPSKRYFPTVALRDHIEESEVFVYDYIE